MWEAEIGRSRFYSSREPILAEKSWGWCLVPVRPVVADKKRKIIVQIGLGKK
jgi:hypothetical protein